MNEIDGSSPAVGIPVSMQVPPPLWQPQAPAAGGVTCDQHQAAMAAVCHALLRTDTVSFFGEVSTVVTPQETTRMEHGEHPIVRWTNVCVLLAAVVASIAVLVTVPPSPPILGGFTTSCVSLAMFLCGVLALAWLGSSSSGLAAACVVLALVSWTTQLLLMMVIFLISGTQFFVGRPLFLVVLFTLETALIACFCMFFREPREESPKSRTTSTITVVRGAAGIPQQSAQEPVVVVPAAVPAGMIPPAGPPQPSAQEPVVVLPVAPAYHPATLHGNVTAPLIEEVCVAFERKRDATTVQVTTEVHSRREPSAVIKSNKRQFLCRCIGCGLTVANLVAAVVFFALIQRSIITLPTAFREIVSFILFSTFNCDIVCLAALLRRRTALIKVMFLVGDGCFGIFFASALIPYVFVLGFLPCTLVGVIFVLIKLVQWLIVLSTMFLAGTPRQETITQVCVDTVPVGHIGCGETSTAIATQTPMSHFPENC